MLQVYLYGETESGFLEINTGTVLEMENLFDLFDEDLSTGEFSLPIEIPWTEGNRRKMSFAERIENFKQNKNFWEVDVYDHGFPELQRAKLTILDKTGNFSYKKGSFNATISGTKGLFGSIIKNKKLRDLRFGGTINWADKDSRQFATDVMHGNYPQYPYIAFAPVAIENFFDQNKDYNDEFIAKDTVNFLTSLATLGDEDAWVFGRPLDDAGIQPADEGTEEYIDYRSVPFFNFKYILRQCFEELGYTVSGEVIDNNDFNDLYIFNNQSIDFFSTSVYLDYNRKIVPTDHVPDILLIDFFRKVFAFFNVYPVIGTTHIELKYRTRTFTERRVLDITAFCDAEFTSTFEEVTDDEGYTLQYGWDSNDSFKDDRVKDLTTKTLVATVSTVANLGVLDIGRTFTTDDIVYVEAENMYYACANALSTPILWDAWAEGLDEYKVGGAGRTVDLGIGTLCTYVEYDETDALYERRNRVGCRMPGSYWTNKGVQVKSPFGLSLFYIKKTIVDTKNIPVSFNHNTAPAGNVMERFSLALMGPNGFAENMHKQWQDLQETNETVKVKLMADKKLLADMAQANTIQIKNILFLPKKSNTTIPLQGTISMELKPL